MKKGFQNRPLLRRNSADTKDTMSAQDALSIRDTMSKRPRRPTHAKTRSTKHHARIYESLREGFKSAMEVLQRDARWSWTRHHAIIGHIEGGRAFVRLCHPR